MTTKDPHTQRRIWGRRKAHGLKTAQQSLMDTLLPQLQAPIIVGEKLDIQTLFPDTPTHLVRLEIGFGGGEHLCAQATRQSQANFIGCEPFINGVASCLTHLSDAMQMGMPDLSQRVRIVIDDARLLLRALPPESVDRIDVLFPDPWPKKRHHKRRIISTETRDLFWQILKPGGTVFMATDIPDYALWMEDIMNTSLFIRHPSTERPDDMPATRYEQKALDAGRTGIYLTYTKLTG